VSDATTGQSPLDLLSALAVEEVEAGPDLRHLEIFTMEGLLGIMWHGDRTATDVVVAGGGGMGGFLGPAHGLYHDLGESLPAQGIGVMRVDYRRPSHLDRSLLDMAAAVDLAARAGAERFLFLGHSFGGAVAIQAALTVIDYAAGVVTLATQSAGCEHADRLGDMPLLLFHGDRDEILASDNSAMVQTIAGTGEVVIYPGAHHLLNEAADDLRGRLTTWIPEQFAHHAGRHT